MKPTITYRSKVIAFISLCALILWSCSTEKEALLNRSYHNMTAHYNGYFNAKEIIKEARQSFKEANPDDYTQLLSIYRYADDDNVEALRQPMETAIDKTSTVINKNAMPNPEKKKGKKRDEWCKWIDDNWYVMGQANFHKRDFDAARIIFKYIKTNYPSQEITYWADLWLAKTAIESEDYANALSTLEILKTGLEKEAAAEKKAASKSKSKTKKKVKPPKRFKAYDIARPIGKYTKEPSYPKNFKGEMYVVMSDLYLRREEFTEAIQHLELAIEHTKNKKTRTRLTYILAQIYEKQGNNGKAREQYDLVTKMTAPYEMEFYATINKALLFDGNDTKGLRAKLNKMAKDDKNKDYLDQIYFVLAELDFKEDEKENGIAHLQQSARFSTTNNKQKAKTYVKLADIYYGDKLFPESKQYYDSSLTVIDDTYDNYDAIVDRSEGLTSLVKNLNTYTFQDSVLNLVVKGEKHYTKVIDRIIEEKRLQDERDFEEKQNNQTGGGSGGQFNNNFGSGTEWYFYNKEAVAFGISGFKTAWGDRKLENNWRRSNKASNAIVDNPEQGEKGEDDDKSTDPYEREFYLKNLPLTDEEQDAANKEIANALYNLGVIYKQKLNEPQTGIQYFEKLVNRYGDSERGLPGMYQLYIGYKANGKNTDSDIYKNKILNEYPDSEYAKIILNPDFKKQEEMARKEHSKEYNAVFDKYLVGGFDEVVANSDEVVARREVNSFIPKYLLLKAYALGAKDAKNLDAIKEPLEVLVKQHSESEEGIKAKDILERLKNQSSIKNAKDGESTFIYNSDMEHFFVLIFPNENGTINPLKVAVSNFNGSSFASQKLKMRNTFINKDNQIVVVRSFKNKNTAIQYLKSFKANKTGLKDFNTKYEYFVITHKNYASFYAEKDIEGYLKFYRENY